MSSGGAGITQEISVGIEAEEVARELLRLGMAAEGGRQQVTLR